MWYWHIRNIVIIANPHTFITASGMLKGTTDRKVKILCNYGHFYTEVKISFLSFWKHSSIHWWLARPVTVSPQSVSQHFHGSCWVISVSKAVLHITPTDCPLPNGSLSHSMNAGVRIWKEELWEEKHRLQRWSFYAK